MKSAQSGTSVIGLLSAIWCGTIVELWALLHTTCAPSHYTELKLHHNENCHTDHISLSITLKNVCDMWYVQSHSAESNKSGKLQESGSNGSYFLTKQKPVHPLLRAFMRFTKTIFVFPEHKSLLLFFCFKYLAMNQFSIVVNIWWFFINM